MKKKTHLRIKATEPFLRANRALSDAFLAATIWATLTPVWARACFFFRRREAEIFEQRKPTNVGHDFEKKSIDRSSLAQLLRPPAGGCDLLSIVTTKIRSALGAGADREAAEATRYRKERGRRILRVTVSKPTRRRERASERKRKEITTPSLSPREGPNPRAFFFTRT